MADLGSCKEHGPTITSRRFKGSSRRRILAASRRQAITSSSLSGVCTINQVFKRRMELYQGEFCLNEGRHNDWIVAENFGVVREGFRGSIGQSI